MSTYRIRNDSLVDIGLNVDTSDLEAKMDEIDEALNSIRSSIESLEGEMPDKVSEDSVTQAVDDYLDDKLQDRVDSAIENADFDTPIQGYLDSNGFVNSDGVQSLIDDSASDMDEDEVRRIVDEAISEADNTEVRDLERRLDLYAQKVDALTQKVASLENASQDATTLLGLLRRAAEIILNR